MSTGIFLGLGDGDYGCLLSESKYLEWASSACAFEFTPRLAAASWLLF